MIDCKVLPTLANPDHQVVLFDAKNKLKCSESTLENNFNKINFQLASSMFVNDNWRNTFCNTTHVDDFVEHIYCYY